MSKKLGKQTFSFKNPPVILNTGTVAGPLEGKGPLKDYFDHVYQDTIIGEKSFESAERQMLLNSAYTALNRSMLPPGEIDVFISGDLLNQIISSGFAALKLAIPFLGIYGACSTSAEGLAIGAMLIDGGFCSNVLISTSSHNSSAERQYRYPTEYGLQRKPNAQWTVTGAGSAVLSKKGQGPKITHVTIGKVVDLGCKDPMDMGSAMAPAAASTIIQHFNDTGRSPADYDIILTGDLGKVGKELLIKLAATDAGYDLNNNYNDCGLMIYDIEKQDVHSGGSGCASSALVVFGYVFKEMLAGKFNRVLMTATGALHSPTSFQQGENIPSIAHAVSLEMN